MDAQPDTSLKLAIIFVTLHLVGWGYNAVITWAEQKKYLEGHTAYAVAAGVAFTLAPFIAFESVRIWWLYAAFVASGSPMMIGAWWRHVTAREAEQQALAHE
jgi:hypothetical protein